MNYKDMFKNEYDEAATKKMLHITDIGEPIRMTNNNVWWCGYSEKHEAFLFVGMQILTNVDNFPPVGEGDLRKHFEERMIDYLVENEVKPNCQVKFCHLQAITTENKKAILRAHLF